MCEALHVKRMRRTRHTHLQLEQLLARLLSFRLVADFLSLEFSLRLLLQALRLVPERIARMFTSQNEANVL